MKTNMIWNLDRRDLLFLLFFLIPIGLLFSPFLLTITMFAVVALLVFDVKKGGFPWVRLNRAFWQKPGRFLRRPTYWPLCLYFLILLLPFYAVEDPVYWLSRIRIKLPFLLLPPVFFFLPALQYRQIRIILYFLVFVLMLTGLGVVINYLANMEAINTLIQQGQPMPVPGNHIRFSLLVCFGILAGIYLWQAGFWLWRPWERYLIGAASFFLFVFMHILSVRTGLVIMYLVLLGFGARFVLLERKYLLGIALLVGLVSMPVLAYRFIPSLRTKIDYVRYDFFILSNGWGNTELSDSGRLISLQIGWQIFKSAPVLGVGPGNLKKEVYRIYETDYVRQKQKLMPHNQFLSVLAGSGIVGLFLFLAAFFLPVFFHPARSNWLFLGLHAIVLFSFMVENTIENAEGTGFYCYFLLLLMHGSKPADQYSVGGLLIRDR